jgi:hypothetical protein
MAKKMTNVEINAIVNSIRTKVDAAKEKAVDAKLSKDKNYQLLKKLRDEQEVLQEKINTLSNKARCISNELTIKYNVQFRHDGSIYNNDSYKIQQEVYNKVVILNISKEVDVEALIEKLAAEYIK